MTISIWGWGSCGGVITTWGWGEPNCSEIIPSVLSKYLIDYFAYSCVPARNYLEIKSRHKGTILLRIRSDQIPERLRLHVLQRTTIDILLRECCDPELIREAYYKVTQFHPR